ncbi:MAG: PAS domain S-box protein [Candidatus Nanopelagicales bacterium]
MTSQFDDQHVLHQVLESLPDPHVLLAAVRDERGAIVDFTFAAANSALAEFERVPLNELIGSSFLALHPDAERQLYFEKLVAVVETGEPLVMDDEDYDVENLGGERRWFDVRASKVGDGVGQVIRDVTERHRAAEQLQRAQRDYRLLAENASDVVFRCNALGEFEWLSDSVADLVGWAPEDLLGAAFLDLVHGGDRENLALVHAGMLPGVPATVNVRVQRRDGGHRWVSVLIRAIRDESGAVVGTVGGWRDIDEQVTALHDVVDLRDQHVLLQSMSTEVVVLEVDGRLRWVSSAVERLLGWEPEDLRGQATELLWDPRDDTALEDLRRAALDGRSEPVVCRLRDVRGAEIWAQITARPWVTRDDEDGIALTLADHRPLHHAAGALLALQEQLDRALNARTA